VKQGVKHPHTPKQPTLPLFDATMDRSNDFPDAKKFQKWHSLDTPKALNKLNIRYKRV
jgi:hypothetical protein